jgi:chromosomal replication initiator protein
MAEWNYEQFWKETMDYIRDGLGKEDFSLGFNMKYLRATENEMVISVPTSLQRDMIKKRYLNIMETKLKDLIDKNISIVFEINPDKEQKDTSPLKSIPENKETAPGTAGSVK